MHIKSPTTPYHWNIRDGSGLCSCEAKRPKGIVDSGFCPTFAVCLQPSNFQIIRSKWLTASHRQSTDLLSKISLAPVSYEPQPRAVITTLQPIGGIA